MKINNSDIFRKNVAKQLNKILKNNMNSINFPSPKSSTNQIFQTFIESIKMGVHSWMHLSVSSKNYNNKTVINFISHLVSILF